MTDLNALESVYFAALEKPPAERPAFLATACGGDADLRARVERLLAAQPRVGSFLEPPDTSSLPSPPAAAGETVDRPGQKEAVGAVLGGRYKLVEAIGEGGMGQVFLAQQTEPVKRAVAVKVIKAGMDSKAVLARFEAERQALALMDHPHIARVLDAGTTESGRPYFVMELVKGVPITQFCDERKLTPKERLELFVPVCQAIQHAHQKGVIHRDIKPSNVLVALYDDRPVPKVIDFGIAKAAGQILTERTLMTGFGAVVGTPEYMSPEQASLNNLDVDTRSDVYSLGVLLYELLTGTTPVDRKALGQAALLEVLRVVREVEAPKPSAKLSTIDTLPSVAANRGTEPAKLSKLMKGELDWLVLKALEKDRTRRYETANAFAADVQRYLSGEPVAAVPPSAGYRFRKFVRKNRGAVAAAAAVFLTLLLGIAGTTAGLIQADQARVRERERADGEHQAKLAEQEAKREADRTRASEAEAHKREAALTRAELLAKIGDNHTQTRKYADALAAFEEANTLLERTFGPDHPATLTALKNLAMGCSRAGKHERAHPLHTEYLKRVVRVYGPDDPVTLQNMRYVAWYYGNGGRRDLALQLFEQVYTHMLAKQGADSAEAVSVRFDLAREYAQAGQPEQAVPHFEAVLASYRKARANDQAVLQVLQGLSEALRAGGRIEPRIALHEEEVKLSAKVYGGKDVMTLYSTARLAAVYHEAGRTADAVRLYEQVDRTGNNDHSLLWVKGQLVECYVAGGAHTEAAKLAKEQLAGARRISTPNSPQLSAALAKAGSVLARVGDWSGCETVLRECDTIRTKHESDVWHTFETKARLGEALLRQELYAEAEPLLVKGYEGMKAREKAVPKGAEARIPETLDRLIELYTTTGKPDEVAKYKELRAKYRETLPAPRRE